jgi:hypothetical protein
VTGRSTDQSTGSRPARPGGARSDSKTAVRSNNGFNKPANRAFNKANIKKYDLYVIAGTFVFLLVMVLIGLLELRAFL